MDYLERLSGLLEKSYSPYHAIANIEGELKDQDFKELKESEPFDLVPGGCYYVKRNGSSIIAFKLRQEKGPLSFKIASAHSDSPTFKLKPSPIIERGDLLLLNTEPYGGGIYSTWMDRPLSIAGRLLVEENGIISPRLFAIDRDLCSIPNLCIHFCRDINSGHNYNPAKDTLPILGVKEGEFDFKEFLKREAGIENGNIIGSDLFLYSRQKPAKMGLEGELFSSPRLDDLASAYTVLFGFLEAKASPQVEVYCCFDNEEVGSLTRQGAHSDFLKNTLKRICDVLGEEYEPALARSFNLSVDNAHATHPNYSEVSDPRNPISLNGGIVIKYNANQSYTSDGLSSSLVKALCLKHGLLFQEFANKSDIRGGSTLGNISNSEVSLLSCDIGLPQLAMHSSNELMGSKDVESMVNLSEAYYGNSILISPDSITIE